MCGFRYYLNAEFNDVSFDMQLLDDIKIGETFSAVWYKFLNEFGCYVGFYLKPYRWLSLRIVLLSDRIALAER